MNRKKVRCLLLILTFFCFSTFKVEAQTWKDSLQNIKELIRKQGTVSTEGIGLHSTPSKYWYAFIYLASVTAMEELEALTNDNNTALRVYAYLGLSYNNSLNPKRFNKKFFKDKATVNTFFGCISNKGMSVAACIKFYTKHYYNESWTQNLITFLKSDRKYSDKLYADLINDRQISRPLLIDY